MRWCSFSIFKMTPQSYVEARLASQLSNYVFKVMYDICKLFPSRLNILLSMKLGV